MSTRTKHLLGCLAVILGGAATPRCEEPPSASDAGVDGGGLPDASPLPDARSVDASPPDAAVPPDGTIYDYCDQPFFKLHIGGEAEDVFGLGISGSRIAYARGPYATYQTDVYTLDLETCEEKRLTHGSRAGGVTIREDVVLWSDNRVSQPAPSYHCMDLFEFDLTQWTERRLTDHPFCEWNPVTNSRRIAFERSVQEGGGAPRENLLWDRVEGTFYQFSDPGAQAGHFDINEDWLAWSGYPPTGNSLGKDVFVRNLTSGEELQLPNSASFYCYLVKLWGEYLAYSCSELWLEPPFHLFLRHLPTGEELHLDGGDNPPYRWVGSVTINAGIVAWNTTRHSEDSGPHADGSNVELYDIETGIYRRLTSLESVLSITQLHVPWAAFAFNLGTNTYFYDRYMGNLERLGVLDANGRLIEGGPVLDPPQ